MKRHAHERGPPLMRGMPMRGMSMRCNRQDGETEFKEFHYNRTGYFDHSVSFGSTNFT